MDSRADFQRFLDGMDQVIQAKRQELSDLEEQLESARVRLSEKEAKELRQSGLVGGDEDGSTGSGSAPFVSRKQFDEFVSKQKHAYEQQLRQFGDELTEFDLVNKDLLQDNEALKRELVWLRDDNRKLNAKQTYLEETCKEIESANLELNLRLAHAQNESTMQQKLLRKTQQEDEVLMKALNDKLESLQKAIEWRDNEIERLRSENYLGLESFGIYLEGEVLKTTSGARESTRASPKASVRVDEEKWVNTKSKQKVLEIVGAIRERDSQIELLKNQLIQATKDLEQNASLIETMRKRDNTTVHRVDSSTRLDNESGLSKQLKLIESELEAKDKQLHAAKMRNLELEKILPNKIANLIDWLTQLLDIQNKQTFQSPTDDMKQYQQVIAEFIEELKQLANNQTVVKDLLDNLERLNNIIKAKDAQIARLVSELNRLDDMLKDGNLETFPAEIEHKLNDDMRIECSDLSDANRSVIQNKSQILTKEPEKGCNDMVIEKEEERRSNDLDVSQSVTNNKQIPRELNTIDEAQTNVHDLEQEQQQSHSSTKPKPEASEKSVQRTIDPTTSLGQEHVLQLHNRLKQLENENELLELAMKEILMSIRWTDSQCNTILIDCPSLERLCQLIEARFLASTARDESNDKNACVELTSAGSKPDVRASASSQLFQMIVLKSELDLVRGQNEQLRTEIKSQRRDYLTCLANNNSSSKESPQVISDELRTDKNLNEVECQTEINSLSKDMNAFEGFEARPEKRCINCKKLVVLSNHLLQTIVRIETRVSSSDEGYIKRLLWLMDLIKNLEQNLRERERQLNESRQRCHLLNQQKLLAESRLGYMESSVSKEAQANRSHISQSVGLFSNVFSTNGNGAESIHSLTTINRDQNRNDCLVSRQLEMPSIGNARMTITLLQSIIGCLQARLDHKDERLQHMESILSSRPIIST